VWHKDLKVRLLLLLAEFESLQSTCKIVKRIVSACCYYVFTFTSNSTTYNDCSSCMSTLNKHIIDKKRTVWSA